MTNLSLRSVTKAAWHQSFSNFVPKGLFTRYGSRNTELLVESAALVSVEIGRTLSDPTEALQFGQFQEAASGKVKIFLRPEGSR
jgi:hypothetical protein